jgi:hypothetical protein
MGDVWQVVRQALLPVDQRFAKTHSLQATLSHRRSRLTLSLSL